MLLVERTIVTTNVTTLARLNSVLKVTICQNICHALEKWRVRFDKNRETREQNAAFERSNRLTSTFSYRKNSPATRSCVRKQNSKQQCEKLNDPGSQKQNWLTNLCLPSVLLTCLISPLLALSYLYCVGSNRLFRYFWGFWQGTHIGSGHQLRSVRTFTPEDRIFTPSGP